MVKRLIPILLFVTAGLSLCGFSWKNQMIFYPTDQTYNTPKAFGIKYEELELTGESGLSLKAWKVPGPEEDFKNGMTILLFAGNGGNMSVLVDRLVNFHLMGHNCFTIDYPGFGRSQGQPSEQGTYEAAEAAWKHLTTVEGLPPERIVVYGFSLGGGVAADLAAKHQPAGLILDSTFTKLAEVTKNDPKLKNLALLVLGDDYNTVAKLKNIRCPLLVLHSREDRVVPYELGRQLFEAYSNNSKTFITGEYGHMDFMLNYERYLPAIKIFIESLKTDQKP